MTENCIDIGTIQAFLDGELDYAKSETVAEHIGACDDCALQLAVAEEESSMAFAALEQEFNTLVPTQRLWSKINGSIEQQREKTSFWTPIFAFFKQPSIAAFAGLLIVAGLFAVVLNRGTGDESKIVATSNANQDNIVVPVYKPIEIEPQVAPTFVAANTTDLLNVPAAKNNRSAIRVIQANAIRKNKRSLVRPDKIENDVKTATANETLTGEESYIKTIATLTESVKNRKDEVLKPSARFAFERDMAVADDAIKTMKAEIKQNPNDEAARQILRASYQNKIDLLSSVADKTELLASVK